MSVREMLKNTVTYTLTYTIGYTFFLCEFM